MSDVSKIKAAAFVEKNELGKLVTLGKDGIYQIPEDLHELLVLKPLGITTEQHAQIGKKEEDLMAGMVFHTGTLALEHFKENPDAVELGFRYDQGKNTTVNGLFNRDAKDHTVLSIDTKHKTADMKRVLSYLGDEFANINT